MRQQLGRLGLRLQVGWGLRRIDLHERFEHRVARRLTVLSRRWAIAHARRRVPPLDRTASIPEAVFRRHATGGNAPRIARLLDLVPRGARIVDIGVGHGYVACALLRDRSPERYCGIDLRQSLLDATREMIEANGLGERPVELVLSDVLDLDRDFWRTRDPDTVLLLEVLEHLEDPGAVLRSVAGAVDRGTRIVLSVPLHGRLDRVWGHRSVFDRSRVERLCRQAGLAIERADPVQSTWMLVRARVDSDPSPSAAGPDPSYTFARIPLRRERGATREGSASFACPDFRLLRLDLTLERVEAARRLRVEGFNRSGARTFEWIETPRRCDRATYVLRPRQPRCLLRAAEAGNGAGLTSVRVSAEAEPTATVPTVTVNRAAYVAAFAGRR